MNPRESLILLRETMEGDLYSDALHKAIYATDASVYRKIPLAVACPKSGKDIKALIAFAKEHHIPLLPRAAGTSLAGQCVGEGIIVDVSRYFTRILAVDEKAQTVTVEPGVIRDELNQYLKASGLFFGPNTSTSNRCMIGGMTGNNSSGTTSIKYGVTRDKVIAIDAILSDGSEVTFTAVTGAEFDEKTTLPTLEGKLYKTIKESLSGPEVQENIRKHYPKPGIHRRNTGYAIDELIKLQPFTPEGEAFNFCKLIAGSEGTLAFITKVTLKLDPLPPENNVMIAAHFNSIASCCKAVTPLMKHDLYTCEMMDKIILDCTKNNSAQAPNRFFIKDDPQAILMLELRDDNPEELQRKHDLLVETLEALQLSYAWPSLYGDDIQKALELRKAGLGLLGNMTGDKKAVACIEDTAVALDDLADYIEEFSTLMNTYGQEAVYYAHAGAGELHLRPILNLKKETDVVLFRKITTAIAGLVKKYKGSLSGEHGDGIVRSEFIKMMTGDENYSILKQIKTVFDPDNIFNPGKIIDPLPMDQSLRYQPEREEPELKTQMDFSDSLGILRATEKCNGSGDCRKTHHTKGAMCPSYHATKNEKDTTRARANALREFLTNSEKKNRFNHPELKEVFDLCLSCKACSSECPSNVDVATLKAEFLYQYQKTNGTTLQDRAFAYNTKLNALASRLPALSNAVFANKFTGNILKKRFGIAPERNFPEVSKVNFRRFLKTQQKKLTQTRKVVLYIDEFTRYLDTTVGKDAIELLSRLGYAVELFYGESGRTFISKGFLKQAEKTANRNITQLQHKISEGVPFVGIEPSALLSFRDEYMRLAEDKKAAAHLAQHSFLIEEFLSGEVEKGNISASQFTKATRVIKFHGHCHQKALSNQKYTFDVLNLPENYKVTIINSGCCGMAGSFGYEKQHYEVSMQVGELKLFPSVRNAASDVIIAANGTSCRHQIVDGTGRTAPHPVGVLKEALV